MIKTLLFGCLFRVLLNGFAFAGDVYIPVGEAQVKKPVLALNVNKIDGLSSSENSLVQKTIQLNLFATFMFEPTNPNQIVVNGLKEGSDDWMTAYKQRGAESVLQVSGRMEGPDLMLDFKLFDVVLKKPVFGQTYKGGSKSPRRIVHTFTTDLIKKLLGTDSVFLHKLAFFRQEGFRKPKELFVGEWDSYGSKQLSEFKSIPISVEWTNDPTKVLLFLLTRYQSGRANWNLIKYDVVQKDWITLMDKRAAANVGVARIPGSSDIVLRVPNGNAYDLTIANQRAEVKRTLLRGGENTIDVEFQVSPDGKQLAFASNRSGASQIYTMNLDGSGLKRVTFAGVRNSTPNWSPDGKKIVFYNEDRSVSDIFLLELANGKLTRLTQNRGKCEGPVFSLDGRGVLFTSNRSGHFQMYMTDLEGKMEIRLTHDSYDYFQPKWSP